MASFVVVDTCVLQKANAPISMNPGERTKFRKRLVLLSNLYQGRFVALISERLLSEYRDKVPLPRNDFIRAFFELLDQPNRAITNWCRWSGQYRSHARKCRFPPEDYHVLRTAIYKSESTILSEERRMLDTDACIHQRLRVHVIDPTV